jgi:transposase-like protein
VVKDIRRATRRQFSAEEKIRIVLEGLRGEESSERGVDFVGVSRRLTRVVIEG